MDPASEHRDLRRNAMICARTIANEILIHLLQDPYTCSSIESLNSASVYRTYHRNSLLRLKDLCTLFLSLLQRVLRFEPTSLFLLESHTTQSATQTATQSRHFTANLQQAKPIFFVRLASILIFELSLTKPCSDESER